MKIKRDDMEKVELRTRTSRKRKEKAAK